MAARGGWTLQRTSDSAAGTAEAAWEQAVEANADADAAAAAAAAAATAADAATARWEAKAVEEGAAAAPVPKKDAPTLAVAGSGGQAAPKKPTKLKLGADDNPFLMETEAQRATRDIEREFAVNAAAGTSPASMGCGAVVPTPAPAAALKLKSCATKATGGATPADIKAAGKEAAVINSNTKPAKLSRSAAGAGHSFTFQLDLRRSSDPHATYPTKGV